MSVTPLDFAAIIGLSFYADHVPVSNESYVSTMVRNKWLKDFFGATVAVKSSCISLV